MEAIIRTDDKNTFYFLVQFLKSLHIEVETKQESKLQVADAKIPKRKELDLNTFSFAQSMEATKGIKGSLSDAVIEERRSE